IPQNITYASRSPPYVQRGTIRNHYNEIDDRIDIENRRFDMIHDIHDDDMYF
ncbi:unnamed protein product, partial [Rotaria sordida]